MGNKHLYVFGAFKLDSQQKILLRDEERIPLHPKTFATLLALLECNGEVISKDDLMAKVWPDAFVEESNLTKNISNLRKAFRNGQDHSDYIETLSGVGYRFAEQVQHVENVDEQDRRNGEVTQRVNEAAPPVETHDPAPLSSHRFWFWSGLALLIIISASMAWWAHSAQIKPLVILQGLMRQRALNHVPNAKVYQLCVQGRERWNRRTTEDLLAARELFEQAVALDGQYAEAHAGVADCYALLNVYGAFPAKDVYPKALAAANYALSLDDTLAQTYATVGFINYRYLWDWKAAERAFQRALELDPKNETAQHWYGEFLVACGRFDEGLAHLRTAEQINPFSLIIKTDLGWDLFLARRYDEAAAQLRRALEMDPNYEMAYYCFADLYAQQGQWVRMIEALRKCPSLIDGGVQGMSQVRIDYARMGFREAIRKWMKVSKERRAQQQGYTSPMEVARFYVLLGEKEDAFKWLDIAWNEHNADLAFLKVNPNFDPLRSDTRFTALLQRMNLAP